MLTIVNLSTGSLISSLIAEIITANLSTSSWLFFSASASTFELLVSVFTTFVTIFCTGTSSLTKRFITFDDIIINSANEIKQINLGGIKPRENSKNT